MAFETLKIGKTYKVWKLDGEQVAFTLLGFGPLGMLVKIDGVHYSNFEIPPHRLVEEMPG